MAKKQLIDVAAQFADRTNPRTKYGAGQFYELYEHYLGHLVDSPVNFVELGVYTGELLKTFGSYFSRGRVLGIDIEDHGADYSGQPNVTFTLGDQRDGAQLVNLCKAHAPDGLDIIIDDASHYGTWSLNAYLALSQLLRPGGFYIVEDWGTAYWDDWPDGSRFQQFTPEVTDGQIGKRIPSHDFGMAGFVKYLVDEVMSPNISATREGARMRPHKFDSMHIHREMVVLKKSR